MTTRMPFWPSLRWSRTAIAVVLALLSAAAIRHLRVGAARRKRDATYQAALRAYSHDLSPGSTRKAVESYLQARNTTVRQVCCGEAGDYADLIQVGEESPPWYCSESYVYVAIEFAAVELHDWQLGVVRMEIKAPHKSHIAYDSDVLTKVQLLQEDMGCL